MAELLLELLSEEIPARMQARAVKEIKRLVTKGLTGAGLTFEHAEAFATPRRLTLVIEDLPKSQPDISDERRGPRVGAPDKAVQGFLKSVGLTLDQIEQRETDKGTFYVAVIERKGRPTAEVLAQLLADAIAALPWPKSMRWGPYLERWVRPLHGVLCLFDGAVVPLNVGHISAGDGTRGHRFLAPEPFKVKDFADYRNKLRGAYVVLDAKERQEIIMKEAERLAGLEELKLRRDDALLAEVAGMVEWPVVLMGRIDEQFMDLPPEVLTAVMRTHQKYFSLETREAKLAPRFIVVAHIEAEDGGKAIVAGNERVLRARLADAKFFWDQDRKQLLEERVPALKEIVFHAKLGTLAEKTERMGKLASGLIAQQVANAAGVDAGRASGIAANAERAASLAKADLVTEMVAELPELQGVMGRYYALNDGEGPEVADAIAEHYAPRGPNDRCPTAPVSVAVALADKIDTLVGFFAIGEKPTGSKDLFALRRAALGVIRLILENNVRLPLRNFFAEARLLYKNLLPDSVEGGGVATDLLDFFADRLKVHLKGEGTRHDLIDAVFAAGRQDDLVEIIKKVNALQDFLDTEDGAHLLTAYRRAANIVRIEERRDGKRYDGNLKQKLLDEPEESALHQKLGKAKIDIEAALEKENYHGAMFTVAMLRPTVDAFFDHVTVNCEDDNLRKNRLRLLSEIRSTLSAVADFSKIEG